MAPVESYANGRRCAALALVVAALLGGCSSCGRTEASGAEPVRQEDAGVRAVAVEPDAGARSEDAGVDAGPAPQDGGRARLSRSRPGHFFEHADAPIREALANEPIASVERGSGGRSLAFKITLADGTRGYFKPDQTFTGTRWSAEIAAYHLDRELRLGRVAPVVGRSVPWSVLEDAAGDDGRIDELRIGEDGRLRGALIWWVPERVVPLELPTGWARWLRIEEGSAGDPRVSPFQRPGEWRRALAAARREDASAEEAPTVPAPDDPARPAELSDMMVFDYLSHNLDRWGTNNTNVRTVGRDGPLMFLDNAAAFTLRSPRLPQMDARLHAVQRFRRSTIDAVRRFDVERFTERLAGDPLEPVLDERQLRNLELRRAYLLGYVERLVAEHGEEAVYAW